MKMKKAITIILLTMMIVLQFSSISTVYAVNEGSVDVTLVPTDGVTLNKLEPGTTFDIVVHIDNFQDVNKAIFCVRARLVYDANILEYVEFVANNGWSVPDILDPDTDEPVGGFNQGNGLFIMEGSKAIKNAADTVKIRFKVKDDIATGATGTIGLQEITASGGDKVIRAANTQIGVTVEIPQKPEPVISIKSEKYDTENEIISRIIPGTTVKTLRENITVLKDNVVAKDIAIVVEDEAGNTVAEDAIMKTGMKIKVGTTTLNYTASVIGDVDGDGNITINDLAKVKLHYINMDNEKLTGAHLKSANVDGKIENNNPVGINDIGKIKLVLIEKESIQ